MADLPYQAEYAKSGRASCKNCKQKIDQGALRIARMVQSAFHDGKQPNWYHEDCFFQKQRPTTYTDIGNFNKLKTADQKNIKAKIEEGSGIVMPETSGGKGKKGTKRSAKEGPAASGAVKDFLVEYSKSSRATCRHCEIKICKGEVRICKTVYDTEVGSKFGGQPLWHHVKCFNEARSELLYFAGGESLPGIKSLSAEDQKMVKEEIKPFNTEAVPVKKLKEEPKDAKELKEEEKKEKTMEKQNKLFFKHRNALGKLSKSNLHELLEENSQELLAGKDECLDHLADCMAFGALEPCPECKRGQLVLDTYGYKCTGNVSEWTKCCYVTTDPKRKPLIIPNAYASGSIFNKYKPKVDKRLFNAAPPPPVLVKQDPVKLIKKDIPIPPLKNLQFFIYGKLKTPKEELKNRILKLGGLVVNKLTDTTAAVVSSAKDVERMPDKMKEIQEKDIEVVDESFFDLIDPATGTVSNTLQLIVQHNIAEWGSDPKTRLPQDVLDGKSIPKSGSMYVKSSKSSVQKLKLKGGTAVDPDSGLENIAHVYTDHDGTKYTSILTKTDVVAQKNSYYKLQVLKHDIHNQYWLFRAWGRIGTTIGGNKVEDCKSRDDAINRFESLYLERTENPWECRDNFMKVPNCYYPVDVEYGGEEASDKKSLREDKVCTLPSPVQKLIQMIFDVESMKKVLLEFELDTEKMPLGKLSKKQIKSGYEVLSKLMGEIQQGKANQGKIVDATNRFFTLIPHDFGVNNPPLLDMDLIKSKSEMLDNLLEIEIAYSLLESDDSSESPITAHYKKLKAEIAPLDRGSDEYDLISTYMRNTHAATHSNYTLELQEVFKVVREGEDKRYKPFKKLHNRRLLWHGSRTTNFAGIISQGLRIAPPEAPVTGYMFGKGIYFADMVSKSANYCCTHARNNVGLLLLCEVALGNMKECTHAESWSKPPKGMHSVWGVGRTQPDPAGARTLPDGTLVPLGTPTDNHAASALLYNEFIVYDVAQVNVKYLLQTKFNFKY